MDGFAACRRILWFYLGLFDGREPSMSNQLADKRQTRRTGRARRSGNRERVERVLRLLPSQLTEQSRAERGSLWDRVQSFHGLALCVRCSGILRSTKLMSFMALMANTADANPLPLPDSQRVFTTRHATTPRTQATHSLSSFGRLRILANFREYHFANARGRSA